MRAIYKHLDTVRTIINICPADPVSLSWALARLAVALSGPLGTNCSGF